jgi:hypothetical protein
MVQGIFVLAGVAAGFYAGDYASVRFRIPRSKEPFGTVTVYHYLAIQEKNNRQEFVFQGTEQQTCVHSALPHMGFAPCWYAEKHTEQRQTI